MHWIRYFSSKKSQIVEINQQRYYSMDVKTGIPQGSKLGPLLFILYINEPNKCLTKLKFIHFTDDTALYLDINSSTDHTSLFNSELVQAQTWINANKLSLNV